MVAAAAITSIFGFRATIASLKSSREQSIRSEDSDKYENLVHAQETMRTEYREDARRLAQEIREQAHAHNEELSKIRLRQAELEGHIIKQNKFIEGVMLQMQAALQLKDAQLMFVYFDQILRSMREFIEASPIGFPELARNRMMEKSAAVDLPILPEEGIA